MHNSQTPYLIYILLHHATIYIFLTTPPDLLPRRHPHRSYLALLPPAPKRQVSPPTPRLRQPTDKQPHQAEIPLPHRRRHRPPLLAAISQPGAPSPRRSRACPPVLCRRPPTQGDGHVSDVSFQGGVGEAAEGGESECADERGCAEVGWWGGGLWGDLCRKGWGGGWGWV